MLEIDRPSKGKEAIFPLARLLASSFFFFASNHILTVALPLFISGTGLDLKLVGYSAAAMGTATIAAKFFTPALVGKFCLGHLIGTNLVLMSLASLGFVFFKTPEAIVLFRAIYGIPFSIFPILNLLAIAIVSDDHTITQNTSIIGMAMPLSALIAPVVTECVMSHLSCQAAFLFAFGASLLSFLIYPSRLFVSNRSEVTSGNSLSTSIVALCSKPFRCLRKSIVCFFFLGVADSLILTFFPLLSQEIGTPFSPFFMVFSSSMLLSQLFYPKLSLKNRTKLFWGYLALAITLFAIGTSAKTVFYLCSLGAAFLFGIGYSLVETTTNALVVSASNSSVAGGLATIEQLTVCLGRTMGPWCVSFFSDSAFGLRLCFTVLALALLAPCLVFSSTFREWRTKK